MREDITPFELHEIDGTPTLRLHGTEGKHIVVEEDKIATISEVLLGYMMFSTLITLVARKMTRN
jgi:hypothetical protein